MMRSPRVVALGGGHGLATTLTALRAITSEITAIVTVADNGGSSGRLREEFGFLPPGDLRMALAALCSDDEWGRSWAEIMQYRFTSEGDLNGHSLGNLLLTALWDRDEDIVAGLDRVGALLKVVGRVLPMASEPLDIEGEFITSEGSELVQGQIQVATAKGKMESLRLIPASPKVCAQSLQAIADSDFITMGPGSWLSSVMPHVLLKEEAAAIANSSAKRVLVFNMPEADSTIEFAGYTPEEHLDLLLRKAPNMKFDYAFIDPTALSPHSNLQVVIEGLGGQLLVRDLVQDGAPAHHDPKKLTSAFSHIFA